MVGVVTEYRDDGWNAQLRTTSNNDGERMTDFYGTNAGLIAYFAERGTVIADASVVNEAALLIASEYLDNRYRWQFAGYKTAGREQDREWPRAGAYDIYGYAIASDAIPTEVVAATYEIASRQIASPGSLNTDVTMGEAIKSVSVPGAVSITYAGATSPYDLQIFMPTVDAALAPILVGARGVSSLSGRAVRV